MEPIQLLIVDDHPVVEKGLQLFLEQYPEFKVTGTANSGAEGLKLLKKTDPDVILLGLVMPDMDGIEAIHLYLKHKPTVRIIIFSGHQNDFSVYKALEAGARGYILKGTPLPQVVKAIKAVQCGEPWLSPEVNNCILNTFKNKRGIDSSSLEKYRSLTEREKQVFRLLGKGRETQEIADMLCISPKTVAKHRVAIKQKLPVNNVADMANFAVRIGHSDLDI